jgi:hypothetical protein
VPYMDTYNWDFKIKQQSMGQDKIKEILATR